MTAPTTNKTKWLHLRLTLEEYAHIQKQQQASTCRKTSEWVRKVLLHKPITVYTRNQSLDELVAELIELRSELAALKNDFHLLVQKLYTMPSTPEVKVRIFIQENRQQQLLEKVAQIQEKIDQIASLW